MVDKTLVQRKLTLLSDKKREVESYDVRSLSDFKSKGYMQKAIEKMLQEMIEICIDVAKHIIADENFRLPEDTKNSFEILSEQKVLKLGTTKMMKKMVGFRNLVVHLYEKTDAEIVYGIYRKNLGHFDNYTKEILTYLKKR